MGDRRLGLPLAFLLAISAGDPAAKRLTAISPDEPLQRGSLRELLPAGHEFNSSDPNMAEGPNTSPNGRLAQWFNFLNCFLGNWRRC